MLLSHDEYVIFLIVSIKLFSCTPHPPYNISPLKDPTPLTRYRINAITSVTY